MKADRISFELDSPLDTGDRVMLCSSDLPGVPAGCATASGPLPFLKVGQVLACPAGTFRVESITWLSKGGDSASERAAFFVCEHDFQVGEYDCSIQHSGYSLAWITLSDKGAAGTREDASGPLINKLVSEHLDLCLAQGFIIPDEADQLKALLVSLALEQRFDLILTTGGTGVGPRDISPEATVAVIEKRLPGYERAMTAASLAKTPHGAISRAVAGTLGESIIVNMPGSPKAVAECLEPLLPTFKHTLEKLQGDPSDCAVLRK